MNIINALKANVWKTSVDKASVEGRPFGANVLRAYISKPIESCVDLFNKTAGQAFGNSSTCMQSFYSWMQWVAMEYVSATRGLGWSALEDLCSEYNAPYSRELSQEQYGIIAYRDNEYIQVNVKSAPYVSSGDGFDITHGLGYVPVMVCSSEESQVTPGLYITRQQIGVDIDANRVAYSGTESYRKILPSFHNSVGFQLGQNFNNEIVLPTDDSSAHAHLCMLQMINAETGKTISHGSVGAYRPRTSYTPSQIELGKKAPPKVSYTRVASLQGDLAPLSGFAVRHDMGMGNQNFIMHNLDYVPYDVFNLIPYSFRSAYNIGSHSVDKSCIRYISPELERNRRYSLSITTEPYHTVSAIDGGAVCQLTAVNAKGVISSYNQYICVRGNHSSIIAIDEAMSSAGYNNDIIDTIAILDTDYLEDASVSVTAIDRAGVRANCGIGDNLSGLPVVFELNQEFLGDLYTEIKYKYPGGRVFCVGAGLVVTRSGDVTYRLYCAGIPPDEWDNFQISTIAKSSSYTGAAPLAADHNGEKLGPMVKLPGLNGYVRLTKRVRDIKPAKQGWQDAVMYEVEVPFVFGGLAGLTYSTEIMGQIFVQNGYIKAGSCRRYVSVDTSTGAKINPSTLDYNWLGINERKAFSVTSGKESDILGPTEYFETHKIGSSWNPMVFFNAKCDIEIGASGESGYVSSSKLLMIDITPLLGSATTMTVKRLCCVDNSYWVSKGGRAVGYHGREYPAFNIDLDVSDLGEHINAEKAVNIEGRWFIGRCIGGGDCDNDVNEVVASMPFLSDDLAIWVESPSGYSRKVVNGRNTTIDSVAAVNLIASDILPYYLPDYSGSYQNDDTDSESRLIRIKLTDSTGSQMLEQLYASGFDAANAFYNANLQCLYKKTADTSMTYCQTKSFKIIGSEFTVTLEGLVLTIVAFIDDDQSMDDAVEGLQLSQTELSTGAVIGFCNILSPRSNHGGGASVAIDTSRVFHVFSRVPNKYNGVLVEYIGVYKSSTDALLAVAGAESQIWMYYNVLENAFYVYSGDEWQLFYQINDWSGVKSQYFDVMSDDFKSGYGYGGRFKMIFGHQPRRLPLPEHCLYFVEPPPVSLFVESIMDGCRPSSIALRYAGFLTKPAQ